MINRTRSGQVAQVVMIMAGALCGTLLAQAVASTSGKFSFDATSVVAPGFVFATYLVNEYIKNRTRKREAAEAKAAAAETAVRLTNIEKTNKEIKVFVDGPLGNSLEEIARLLATVAARTGTAEDKAAAESARIASENHKKAARKAAAEATATEIAVQASRDVAKAREVANAPAVKP